MMDNSSMYSKIGGNSVNSDTVSSSLPKASSTLRNDRYKEDSQSTFSSGVNSSSSLEVIDLNSVRDISEFTRLKCTELEEYIDDLFLQSKERISRLFEIDARFSKSDNKVGQKVPLSENSNLPTSCVINSTKEDSITTTTSSLDEFRCSDIPVRERLDQDEKENKKKYASLPITPCSISTIDTSGSDATPYFSSRSYGGDDLRHILQEFVEKLSPKPGQNESRYRQHQTSTAADETYISKQKSLTAFGDTYEVSQVSSVASISEIEKILQERSVSADVMIKRLLTKDRTKFKSSLKSTNSEKGLLEMKSGHERDCDRTHDDSNVMKSDVAELNLSKSGANLTMRSEDINRFTLLNNHQTIPVPQLSMMSDKIFDRSERVSPSIPIPKRGFYQVDSKKPDFEIVNASVVSECASMYTSLVSEELADRKNSLYDQSDPNITLSSPHTANFVKECRIKDRTNLYSSCNDLSKNSTCFEPIQAVSSTCNLKSECRKTAHIDRTKDESVNEDIDGGYLCIGTQIKVVLTVINPSESSLHYIAVLKNILVQGKSNLNAAAVMVSDRLVKLDGQTSVDVSFIISPLVCGEFKIVVEFISQNTLFPNVLRTIQLIGKKPSLYVINPTNSCLSFGILPELTHKHLPLVLKNESLVKIPVKFLIYEFQNGEEIREFEARCVMDPNEVLECIVRFSTPEFMFSKETYDSYTKRLDGKLLIMLDTAEDKKISISPLLAMISLFGSVGYTRVHAEHRDIPEEIRSNGYVRSSAEFEGSQHVTGVPFCASPTATTRSGSSSSNSSCDEGTLDLACTHTALTWPCTSIHTKQVQNVTLRNKSDHREKLLLSIYDNTGSFKFLENDKYAREIKIIMEANESRKVSVVFIPRSPERQVSGKINIGRRWTRSKLDDDASVDKRVIPLYGYGGETKLSIHRSFRDSEGRYWLNPDLETLEATFLLKNNGDSLLFVKICHEDADDSVVPEEVLLPPDKSVKIMCNLNLNADRVDILCRQNPSKDTVVVNNITLLYGSEASRQRIKRLWMQKEKVADVTVTRISDKLDTVCDFSEHCDSVKVDKLLDPLSSLSKLWYESVSEQTIGILVSKEILETVSLDKTVVFNDLNRTVIE